MVASVIPIDGSASFVAGAPQVTALASSDLDSIAKKKRYSSQQMTRSASNINITPTSAIAEPNRLTQKGRHGLTKSLLE